MRWLRLAVPATVLAAWLASSFAQQGQPPATPPPAGQPPAARPPPATPPAAEDKEPAPPPANDDKDNEVEVPTELQPDAAVTFPVDI